MSNTRNARDVRGVEGTDGSFFARVGGPFYTPDMSPIPTITAITVTDDLQGPAGPMERVRIWSGPTMLWEGALHHLEGVSYV